MMKRKKSPPVTPAMAAHIRYLLSEQGLYQHQVAAKLGLNQGRVSEVNTGKLHPGVPPAQAPLPF